MFSTLFALLFLIKIKLRSASNAFEYFKKCYGADGLRKYRDVHNLSLKATKLELDLDFLVKCKIYNRFPKFLRFKLYRKSLHHATFYKSWQAKLLCNEIKLKRKNLSDVNSKVHSAKDVLKYAVSPLDFYLAVRSVNENSKISRKKTLTLKCF